MSRCSICHNRDCYESFHEPEAVAERAEQRIVDLEERVAQLEEAVSRLIQRLTR